MKTEVEVMSQPRKFGLNQVYPNPGLISESRDKVQDLDVIAIHGLNAESPKTWIAWKIDGDPNSGNVHWLKDENMLPSILPNARIFTYDWNAGTEKHAATDTLFGHADALLYKLHIKRHRYGSADRPIIWVASCFGGLLLAKALHRASEVNNSYQNILHATAGIVFLGTPFQGGHKGFYTAAEARVVVAMATGAEANNELLKYMRDDATRGGRGELDEVVARFTELVAHPNYKFPIECYYETEKTNLKYLVPDINKLPQGFLSTLDSNGMGVLVERHSACLQGVPSRQLNVRHAMLSKFPSPDNDSFEQISYTLSSFAEGAEYLLKSKSKDPLY
ncbi:nacht nucleoside triphosphatase protein [Rutstroemia sp. NJR-2017a BVV2]|nr:nacht nucleoside triphosphatase protein [Rutstroemia sp. NJR-2017a BVV2]